MAAAAGPGQPENFRIDKHSVSVQICSTDLQPWWLTCVYGPQGDDNKIAFLQELHEVRASYAGPWVILGDFNLIYKEEDKNNANLNSAMMGRFRRFIDDLVLKELPLHGRNFTWSNGQDSPTLVKLDRDSTTKLLVKGDFILKLSGHPWMVFSRKSSVLGPLNLHAPAPWKTYLSNLKQLQEGYRAGVKRSLLGESCDRTRTVDLDKMDILVRNLGELEAPISEDEVWKRIKGLPSDKALGPDGLTGRFYKSCWHTIKDDVMSAISALWSQKFRIFWLLNCAYITLLPKRDDATSVKDFRAISLVHSFAKLVTKILANRLASQLNQLVSPNQSAFIKGRFIQDNFMLVQQTASHQQKQSRIQSVLQKIFGPVWSDIISGLLSTSYTQVLLNGRRLSIEGACGRGTHIPDALHSSDGYSWPLASEEGHLQPLSSRSLHHRISLYADDVVLFLQLAANDIVCTEEEMSIIQNNLPCKIHDFPTKYLGIPLSLKKLSRAQVQPIIDKIADQLSGWKADLMTRAGRVVQVQFVLTAMLVYLIMAIDLPPWAIKAIDKIRRGFLWRGRKEARGGHCLIAWNKVQQPKKLGGLGISNLQTLGWALRMRCCGYRRLNLIGYGPYFLSKESIGAQFMKPVHEALLNQELVKDIQGALSIEVILEFLDLAKCLADFELQPDVLDSHIWRLSPSRQYSSKSAYENFFQGSVSFSPWERIWKSWAPNKCKFFIWLAAHKRCWTADRLAKRNLPHPATCPFCNQEEETIDHVLTNCVFARQFWFNLLRRFNLQNLAPLAEDESLDGWWSRKLESP
ncbi:hypothetical protein U9M48_023441 [Paspalum notatum var. saurae]|uniref:Reverse transcriptase zinc-binding domain-containing protein n=1 Tax=Paspalum notatum var. saurae TaxID=547442 RepID=A0AAQ3WVT0_PASNO